MSADRERKPEFCSCLALRQAARHVTQVYDRYLADSGLRTTQFSVLTKLQRLGPMTINALAEEMVMDRTTLGRNIRPLQRARLIAVRTAPADRRRRELHLTEAGAARLRTAVKGWAEAQARFDAAFGAERATELRNLLRAVTTIDFAAAPAE